MTEALPQLYQFDGISSTLWVSTFWHPEAEVIKKFHFSMGPRAVISFIEGYAPENLGQSTLVWWDGVYPPSDYFQVRLIPALVLSALDFDPVGGLGESYRTDLGITTRMLDAVAYRWREAATERLTVLPIAGGAKDALGSPIQIGEGS